MDKTAVILLFTLVIVCVEAKYGVEQMKQAKGCGGRGGCKTDADCRSPAISRCVHGKCVKCQCNKTEQCVEENYGYSCNCTGSGATGKKCECPNPGCPCIDVFSMLKPCTKFTNYTVTLNDTRYYEHGETAVEVKAKDLDDCIGHMTNNHCHIVVFVFGYCYVYEGTVAKNRGQFVNTRLYTTVVKICETCPGEI